MYYQIDECFHFGEIPWSRVVFRDSMEKPRDSMEVSKIIEHFQCQRQYFLPASMTAQERPRLALARAWLITLAASTLLVAPPSKETNCLGFPPTLSEGHCSSNLTSSSHRESRWFRLCSEPQLMFWPVAEQGLCCGHPKSRTARISWFTFSQMRSKVADHRENWFYQCS